jgi:hypothetical protein
LGCRSVDTIARISNRNSHSNKREMKLTTGARSIQ